MPRVTKNTLRKNPRVSWDEYEQQVKDVLISAGGQVTLRVDGKRLLAVEEGEYEVDAYAEVVLFGGALIKIIVECKRHTRPVARDFVLALHGKIQALGAHKGMLFSTSGFQRAAVSYARKHGIALVKLNDEEDEDKPSFVAYCMAPPEGYMASLRALVTVLAPGLIDLKVPDYDAPLVCVLRSAPRPSTIIGSENPRAFREWLLSSPHPGNDVSRG